MTFLIQPDFLMLLLTLSNNVMSLMALSDCDVTHDTIILILPCDVTSDAIRLMSLMTLSPLISPCDVTSDTVRLTSFLTLPYFDVTPDTIRLRGHPLILPNQRHCWHCQIVMSLWYHSEHCHHNENVIIYCQTVGCHFDWDITYGILSHHTSHTFHFTFCLWELSNERFTCHISCLYISMDNPVELTGLHNRVYLYTFTIN